MGEPKSNKSRPTPLGVYDRPRSPGTSGIEVTAIVLSVVWLLGAAIFFLTLPDVPSERGVDTLRFMMTAMAVFLPVAMVWVAAAAARSARIMREESQRLQTAIDAIRQAYISQSQSGGLASDMAVTRKLEEIAATARKTEAAVAALAAAPRETQSQAAPDVATSATTVDDQPTLALGTDASHLAPPLPAEDFIRALNFPDTAEDKQGFAALRRALKDRSAGQLIQAAQDVLTLLSQEGIYMDDLNPDRARPEIWRSFAQGVRGKEISGLGGIRDRSSLALTSGRMKQDPIFRDAAHHFLRKFDRTFAAFEPNASDADISALADTRTARAFMLLGRVAGTFD